MIVTLDGRLQEAGVPELAGDIFVWALRASIGARPLFVGSFPSADAKRACGLMVLDKLFRAVALRACVNVARVGVR
jgi:hypothetical protein